MQFNFYWTIVLLTYELAFIFLEWYPKFMSTFIIFEILSDNFIGQFYQTILSVDFHKVPHLLDFTLAIAYHANRKWSL